MMERFNRKGVTLVELLIALVIFGIVTAGIYRLFIAQSRAYTVQDQVSEVQQNVRSAMELLLRDLRMAGYDSDHRLSTVTIDTSIAKIGKSSLTVNYEYYDQALAQYQKHTIAYSREAGSSSLIRQLTVNDVAKPPETLLDNLETLEFEYGTDENEDGALDRWGLPSDSSKVVAVRVTLSARPKPLGPDPQKMISPRKLVSTVALRNRLMK